MALVTYRTVFRPLFEREHLARPSRPTWRCSRPAGSERFWRLDGVRAVSRSTEQIHSSRRLSARPLERSFILSLPSDSTIDELRCFLSHKRSDTVGEIGS